MEEIRHSSEAEEEALTPEGQNLLFKALNLTGLSQLALMRLLEHKGNIPHIDLVRLPKKFPPALPTEIADRFESFRREHNLSDKEWKKFLSRLYFISAQKEQGDKETAEEARQMQRNVSHRRAMWRKRLSLIGLGTWVAGNAEGRSYRGRIARYECQSRASGMMANLFVDLYNGEYGEDDAQNEQHDEGSANESEE